MWVTLFSELVIVRVLQVNALVQAMPRALWMTSLQENCGVSPHYNGFAGVKGGGRYDFQPPQIRQSIRPRGPLYLRRLHRTSRCSVNARLRASHTTDISPLRYLSHKRIVPA